MWSRWQIAFVGLGVILASMSILWLVSLRRRDASVVDPFWGFGFVLLAWVAYSFQAVATSRSFLVCALVTIWGLRLSLYLLWRNWGHGEDRRYALMREYHGAHFWWISLLTVFLLQAVILWVVALPVLMAVSNSASTTWNAWDIVGIISWTLGLSFESIGDWQMARFKSDPANQGKVLRQGLWKYTRHPNYFGDFCVWWGLYLIAVGSGGWWTIFSPLTMSILLMRVSGVTLLESTIQERRPDYADYRQSTNAFFPGFPKSGKDSVI